MAYGYVVSSPFGGHGIGDQLSSVDAEHARNVVRFQLADAPAPVAPAETPAEVAAEQAVTAAETALTAAQAAEHAAQES